MIGLSHLTLVPGAGHGEFRDNAGSKLVASSQWLIVHLGWRQRVREVVLLQARRWRMEEGVDVSYGLVRAVPVLQVDRRRM
jgi:hypothetical protein